MERASKSACCGQMNGRPHTTQNMDDGPFNGSTETHREPPTIDNKPQKESKLIRELVCRQGSLDAATDLGRSARLLRSAHLARPMATLKAARLAAIRRRACGSNALAMAILTPNIHTKTGLLYSDSTARRG